MNLGFLDKALDGGKDLGALVDTLQQAAARTLEFDGEYPAQQVAALCKPRRLSIAHMCAWAGDPVSQPPIGARHVAELLT